MKLEESNINLFKRNFIIR